MNRFVAESRLDLDIELASSTQGTLRINGEYSAQTILDRTLENVSTFSAGAVHVDDLTFITIKHS
ncbi:MAG: hypothetical protein ACON4O_03505 [Lentimonas sp.]